MAYERGCGTALRCSLIRRVGDERGTPGVQQQSRGIAPWLDANRDWFRLGHIVAAFAFLLFYFPFFAGLCERLRQAEGAPAIWSRVS
jgi:hypothetical protein